MSSPSPLQATGLYAPIKDLVQLVLERRRRGLRPITCDVQQMGETTWITVTAQCKKKATEPVRVQAFRAERYEKAFDSCVEPEPVLDRTIRFSPSRAVTLKPGEAPQRWEARFVTEHLRRSARKGEDAATAREMGADVVDTKYEWEEIEASRRTSDRLFQRLLAAIDGPPTVKVRVVLDLQDLRPVESEPFEIPPPPPLSKRLRAALRG